MFISSLMRQTTLWGNGNYNLTVIDWRCHCCCCTPPPRFAWALLQEPAACWRPGAGAEGRTWGREIQATPRAQPRPGPELTLQLPWPPRHPSPPLSTPLWSLRSPQCHHTQRPATPTIPLKSSSIPFLLFTYITHIKINFTTYLPCLENWVTCHAE